MRRGRRYRWGYRKRKAMNPWLYTILVIGLLAFGIWMTYLIGSSDMPDWVKFLLLS